MYGLTEARLANAKHRAEAVAAFLGGCTKRLLAARLRYLALLHPYDAPSLMAEALRLEAEFDQNSEDRKMCVNCMCPQPVAQAG